MTILSKNIRNSHSIKDLKKEIIEIVKVIKKKKKENIDWFENHLVTSLIFRTAKCSLEINRNLDPSIEEIIIEMYNLLNKNQGSAEKFRNYINPLEK